MRRSITAAIAAGTLAATPAVAQAQQVGVDRAATPVTEGEEIGGVSGLLIVLGYAAAIAIVAVVTDDDDDDLPVSP